MYKKNIAIQCDWRRNLLFLIRGMKLTAMLLFLVCIQLQAKSYA